MEKDIYLRLKVKIFKEQNIFIDLNYDEFNSYFEVLKEKIKYDEEIYIKNKDLFDLCEICALVWGFFAFSFSDLKDENNSHISAIFHSLSTQISNNILVILMLCNNSMDYQVGVLLRSTCELLFTLFVLLIDKNKRDRYFNSVKERNAVEVWNEEFKMKDLNAILESFENGIITNEESLTKMLKNWRKDIYKKYSEYVHNSLLSCFMTSYTKAANDKDLMTYNIWGGKSTRIDGYLVDLCQLCFFIGMDLFEFLGKNLNIKNNVNNDEESKKYWNQASYFFLLFKERYLEIGKYHV